MLGRCKRLLQPNFLLILLIPLAATILIGGLLEKQQSELAIPIGVVDLDESDEKRLNIALNRISGYWDIDKLEEVVNDLMADDPSLIDFTGLSEFELDSMFGVEEVDFLDKDGFIDDDDTYVKEIKTPIYEITGKEPSIDELCNHTKTDELINNINIAFDKGSINEEQKRFLKSVKL